MSEGELDKDNREILLASGSEPALDSLMEELSLIVGDGVVEMKNRDLAAKHIRKAVNGDRELTQSIVQSDGAVSIPREVESDDSYRGAGPMNSRVPLADGIINELVAKSQQAFFRSDVHAIPLDAGAAQDSATASNLLRYWINQRLRGPITRELELSAQYVFGGDPGACVIGAFWATEKAVERRLMSLEDFIAEFAKRLATREIDEQSIQEVAQEFSQSVMSVDPLVQEQALKVLQMSMPHIKDVKVFAGIIKKWQEGVEAEIPEGYDRKSEPKIVTYKLGEELIYDFKDGKSIQEARVIYVREVVNEVTLESRLLSGAWNKSFVARLREGGRGRCYQWKSGEGVATGSASVEGINKSEYEVYHAYRYVIGSFGYTELYKTVFSPVLGVDGGVASHDPFYSPLGSYPFVEITREQIERGVMNSRSITSLCGSSQEFMKKILDSLSFKAELSAAPPLKQHMRRAGLRPVLAPFSVFKFKQADDLTVMDLGAYPAEAVHMFDRVKGMVDEYWGRDPERPDGVVMQQVMVGGLLRGWEQVLGQLLALAYDRMDDNEFIQVGGQAKRLNRDELRGRHSVQIVIDVMDLNMDFLIKKLDLIFNYLLRMDNKGIIDPEPIIRFAMNLLDPHLAQSALREPEAAKDNEVKQVQEDLMKMFFGMEAETPDRGADFELRLQVVEKAMQSGKFAEAMQSDEEFAGRVQQYAQHLTNLHQQYEVNPDIGRNVMPGKPGGEAGAQGQLAG